MKYFSQRVSKALNLLKCQENLVKEVNRLKREVYLIYNEQVCIATKYISNYMYWFKWLQLFEHDKEVVKIKNFIVQSNVAHAYTKITDFKERDPEFV